MLHMVSSLFQTDKNKVVHHVRLYIQYHPLLQQDTDVRMIKECESSADDGSSVAQGSITDANAIQVMTPSWMEVIRGPRIDGAKLRGPIKVEKPSASLSELMSIVGCMLPSSLRVQSNEILSL